jgi:hypothetical protein
VTTVKRTSVVVTLAMALLLVGPACKLGRSNEGLDSITANVDGQLSPPGATAAGAPEARDPFDEPPRVTRVYASQVTRRQVIEFYQRELGSRGWSVAVHESDQGMAWDKDGARSGSAGGARMNKHISARSSLSAGLVLAVVVVSAAFKQRGVREDSANDGRPHATLGLLQDFDQRQSSAPVAGPGDA